MRAGIIVVALSSAAFAEERVSVGVTLGGIAPLSEPQKSSFSLGPLARVGVAWRPVRVLALEAQGLFSVLPALDGRPAAVLVAGGLDVLLYVLSLERVSAFLDAGALVAGTGPLVRPLLQTGLGLGFKLTPRATLGLALGVVWLIEPDRPGYESRDAVMLNAGLTVRVALDATADEPRPAPKPQPLPDAAPLEHPVAADAGVAVPEASPDAGAPVKESPGSVVVLENQLQKISFASGSALMSPKALEAVQWVAMFLEQHPEVTRMQIEGHCDGREACVDLSQRRAQAVVDALVSVLGIAEARLEAIGYAAKFPIAPNTSEDGRALNRRVEFHVTRSK